MKFQAVVFVSLAIVGHSAASAATCANWSPKFDGIRHPSVLRELRSRSNWDDLIEQSGGPNAVIANARNTMVDARNRIQAARQAVVQLAANESAAQSSITWDECKGSQSALAAAKCQILTMQEVIMSMEGTIELVQCRAGR